MFALEELGKHRILHATWKKTIQTGRLPSVELIRKTCIDHIEKQKQGQGSVTFNIAKGSRLDAALQTMIEKTQTPTGPGFQTAERLLNTVLRAKRKHDPAERHEKRLEAFFVDLDDSGTFWKRPSKTTLQEEASSLLTDAANNYSLQYHKFSNTALLGDSQLVEALEAWSDKPTLPQPTWPI